MVFWLLFPLLASLLAIAFVVYLAKDVLRQDRGNETMIQISDAVQEGARAFLRREYMYVSFFVVVIFVLIWFAPILRPGLELGLQTALCFAAGAVASAIAGWTGMAIATRANSRTTEAARTGGLKAALSVSISGGAVMGLMVVGVSLLGLIIMIWLVDGLNHPQYINGYAMGASLVALFGRSGGGIFTKGADMGADLVGKVEAGIPEDDPRNPATIADNVGDNVGDVAGLGADLLESYVEAIISAMALASVVGLAMTGMGMETGEGVGMSLNLLPLVIAGVGILASIAGIAYVKFKPSDDPQGSLMMGTYIAAGLCAALSLIVIMIMGREFTVELEAGQLKTFKPFGIWIASLVGIASGVGIGFVSEYYTSSKYSPVKKMANNARMGPAIAVTDGYAIGMMSTGIPVLILCIAVLLAYQFAWFYGVAIAALGMLATTGMIVAVDSYGPIADNAGGCSEMAGLPPEVRAVTDNLDAVGNTTAAIGKGFAIGSAAFAAMALLVAYVKLAGIELTHTAIMDPKVLAGLMLGAMLPYVFSSMLFGAVSKVAFTMIDEVRRQMREIPGIMEGTGKPEYGRCVDISTKGAIRGMMLPGIMAILVPVVVGLSPLGPEGLAGTLVGALISGLALGITCANAGGAMDNAKKYIEEGKVTDDKGNVLGKGSEAHKAAVVGDTVGDPLKDTVGPSINILIKLMAVISLVLAPMFRG